MISDRTLATLAAKNLRPGAVLYRHCYFTTPPKPKYMVVVSTTPRLLVLLINSNIHQYFYSQGLDKFHVTVPSKDHPFLKHDSYANCIDAKDCFDISDIEQAIIEDYKGTFKGWLSDLCLEEVYNAVKENTVIKRRHQKLIISAIETQLPHLIEI
jgi:hypothetical protein